MPKGLETMASQDEAGLQIDLGLNEGKILIDKMNRTIKLESNCISVLNMKSKKANLREHGFIERYPS